MGSLVFRIAGSGGASYSNVYSIDFERDDGDYLIASSTSALDITDGGTAFSISLWVKPEASQQGPLFSKGTDQIFARLSSLNKVTFVLGGGATVNAAPALTLDTDTAIPNGSWSHYVFTYDGSGATSGFKAYLNGSDDTQIVTEYSTFTSSTSITNSTAFQIGKAPTHWLLASGGDAYNQKTFDGKIDEFSFWDKTLSSSEVTAIYNSGTPDNLADHSAYDDLTSWYRMGDHASDDLTADSGQVTDAKGSNHLTPKNTTSSNKVEDVPGS
tara:strand:- start:483 stop:1292 length:810 start_codon:yes stop_codon:yes gene_type:complete